MDGDIEMEDFNQKEDEPIKKNIQPLKLIKNGNTLKVEIVLREKDKGGIIPTVNFFR